MNGLVAGRYRAFAVTVLFASCAGMAIAGDVGRAWPVPPTAMTRFMTGADGEDPGEARFWLGTTRSALLASPDLIQSRLECALDGPWSGGAAWQRTGASGGIWSEDRFEAHLGRGGAAAWRLEGEVRRMGDGQETWPTAWTLAVRVGLAPLRGVVMEARLEAAASRRDWSRWGAPPWLRMRSVAGAWLSVATLTPDGGGAPRLRIRQWWRAASPLAVGVGRDGLDGSVALLLAARRGPLLIRSRHGAHPLLGVLHQWQVVWTGRAP